ncbi:substrate-binding periplasmic protein [Sulfurospirillum arcachonense]|uniref:substrate-binding periplasmic protein n=1 Tax=Sulfurospirillum arcachonense TaxID=57666 RepID=UPI000468A9A9|nr:transporter substrate-binding domain-containing protein [Sulfurospirillum arcachonense]
MFKFIFSQFFSLIILFSVVSIPSYAKELTIFAGKNAPFNFRHRGAITGVTVQILESIFKDANLPFDQKKIVFDSWSAVFSQAIVTSDSLLITASRIPERESLFQWIGPVATVRLAIVAKKNTVKIKKLDDLKNYNVASVKNTSAERAYVKKGGDLSTFSRISTPKQGYRMLEYGRIDALICTDLPFVYSLIKQGQNVDDYEIVYVIKNTKYYIAAHKDLSAKTMNILEDGLAKLKQKNSKNISQYDTIMANYFKGKILSEKSK